MTVAHPTSAHSPSRRMPRARRTEMLLDVAEPLFVSHGFAGVSLEDVAREAGITRPVLYSHFQSKEGLYLALARRARRSYDERIALMIDAAPLGPRAQLELGAEAFFGMLDEQPNRWRLVFNGSAVLPDSYGEELANLRFSTIETIATVLGQAAPHVPPLQIAAAAHSLSGVGERLGLFWLSRPELSRDEVVRLFVEVTWNGIQALLRAGTPCDATD